MRVLVTVLMVILIAGAVSAEGAPPPRHINPDRLQGTLEKLSELGHNPEGGVTRLGFSQEELGARNYAISLMKRVFGQRARSSTISSRR